MKENIPSVESKEKKCTQCGETIPHTDTAPVFTATDAALEDFDLVPGEHFFCNDTCLATWQTSTFGGSPTNNPGLACVVPIKKPE